jgi:peptidoglycan L-alanyl-D-glutamate endopeptidase CwlK
MSKLDGIHPLLIAAVTKIIHGMEAFGYPMMVTDGFRTLDRQREIYAQGRTAPGPVVTQCDGVVKRSNHQAHDDGWGHAVDMTFVVNGQPSWAESLPWALYGEAAKAVGCHWGGDWKSPDRPHIEWL